MLLVHHQFERHESSHRHDCQTTERPRGILKYKKHNNFKQFNQKHIKRIFLVIAPSTDVRVSLLGGSYKYMAAETV